MKILIVSQYFWPEYFRVNELCECLKGMGHDVEVLTGIPNYPQGKYYKGYSILKNRKQTYKGIKISRVPIIPRGEKGGDKRLIPNYISFALFASFSILTKIFTRFDVVLVYEVSPITQAYPAILYRWLKKTPVCLYVFDLWPETVFSHNIANKSFLKELMYHLVYSIYRRCDRIFISSKGFEKNILSSGYDPKRLTYIPNWPENFYKPTDSDLDLRKTLNLPENCFLVMYAGNIGFAQSFGTIIEAAKILKEERSIHFIILGDGSIKPWAIEEVAKYQLENITFLGRKPAEEMPKYIAKADAMIVSLMKKDNYSLTLPSRIQSYFACEKPVIACAGDEVSRVIEESGAGLSCEPDNPGELVNIIKKMSSLSTETYKKMCKNAMEYSNKEFNKGCLINKLNDLIEEAAKDRTRRKTF